LFFFFFFLISNEYHILLIYEFGEHVFDNVSKENKESLDHVI